MKLLKNLFLTLSGLFFFILPSFNASAQGTVQVIVSGIPPVLQSPYVNDVERNFLLGQYLFQIQYTNPDPAPVSFTVEISLSRYGSELFRIVSFPVALTPGTYIYRTFHETPAIKFAEDPMELISRKMREQAVREGVMAEGDYLLEVQVIPESSFAMVNPIPSFTPFEVRFPQPPVLISPFDGESAPVVFPVFSWTPVIGMPMLQFEYEVLIVEILEGQTPLQAIESNREHARITTMQPVMIYTAGNLPLEVGNQYAWQVRTREINQQIPISDQGKTEIFTFTAGLAGDFDAGQLNRIQLVPDFAELINLDGMDISQGGHTVTLNGRAVLRLDFSEGGSGFAEIEVVCNDLEIHAGNLENPVVMGGSLSGNIRGEALPVEDPGQFISIDRIRWGLTEGITLDVKIADPAGSLMEAEGYLNLSSGGLSGRVTATGPAGEPLFSYGIHPVELAVNSITAVFPGAWVTADANIKFFSEPTPCSMPVMELTGGNAEFSFYCPVEYPVPLVPGTDLATLYLHSATGNIHIGEENPSFDYSFNIVSSLKINALEGSSYDVPVFLEVSSETGVTADIRAPPLTYHAPDINLGIAGLQIIRFNDPWISYDPQANQWDFGLEFDAGLKFPSLDNLRLPDLYGITLDREGIHFPSVHFDDDDLQIIPRLDLAGFGARLTSFAIPAFTFPWFDWDGLLPGPWDFDFDFELTLPRFPDYMPYCLRNLKLDVENAGFSGGQFSAVLPSTAFSGNECAIELGAGYGIRLSSLAGELTGKVDAGEFSIDGHLSLDGSMLLGTPFACSGETAEPGIENLFLSSTGIISGRIAGIIPSCPIGIGPYRASVTESLLSFSAGSSGQSAVLDASANLEFPLQTGGTGLFGGDLALDLATGEFTSLNFEIDRPFVWKIPSEDEILVFNVNSAAITLDGLMIDGSNQFMAGSRAIGVAFNQVALDLKNFRIKGGNILFDESFAFEAGIDSDFSLLYRTAGPDDVLSLDPGILFSLAGGVQIDSTGLRTSGSADAAMAFSGFSVNSLSVDFSDDFAFGLDPFKVQEGRMDVLYDNNLVAIVDQFGFHPVLSFFDIESVIPARLPVPHTTVAWLQLKDHQGSLLVDVQNDPDNDLGVIISTLPGQTVDLVLPVLQGELATAPRVGVQFSGVGLSLSPLKFESGQIQVDVSGMAEFMDLEERLGLPFSLEQIAYGNFDDVHEIFNQGLFFTGELKLFDEQLGENSTVTMFVQQDGTVLASFDISSIDHDIPLVADSDIAVLNIEALSGFMSFPLLAPYAQPEYEYSITGGFGVKYQDNMARVDITAGYNRHGFRLINLDYDVSVQRPRFNIDPFIFRIDRVENLHIDYSRESGFDFYAGLDFTLGMKMEEEDLLIPLKGVEIRPSGFVIPSQEINDGTNPALRVQPVSLFGIGLQPLAFRMDGAVVDIYDFDPAGLAGLLPRVDFALTFPELVSQFPELAGVSLTVNDAGFSGGRFTGSVEAHSPLQPIRVTLGSTWLDIHEFSGNLTEVVRGDEPAQGLDLFIAGSVPGLDLFESEEPCDPVDFSFALIEGRGFSGTIENFVPCGAMPIGQLSLMFTGSSLQFGFEQGNQTAVLAGGAELIIPRAGNESETATATGTLEMDLITGRLLDGSIEINNAFNWSLPAGSDDPFFNFVVNSARLDSLGLTLRANGDMLVGENVQVDVNFNDLVIGLDDFRVKDGEATISTGYSTGDELVSSGFAFELLFLPVNWRMVPGSSPVPADTNVIRLNLDGIGVKLNKEGVALTGESTASIHLAREFEKEDEPEPEPEPEEAEPEDIEISFAGLRLALIDGFMFDYRTKTVNSGVAQIWKDEEGGDSLLLAWYDSDGLGIGNFLGVLPIPDTLGLPDNDIAYLVLKNEQGDLVVEIEPGSDGQRTLQTKEGEHARLVLASLGTEEEEPPVFLTEFSVTINSAYEIIAGSIGVDIENNPFKVPKLPVSITSLAYERRDDGVGALTAAARLDLPESLGGLAVNMDELRFSTRGFEQVSLSIGDVSGSDTLAAYALADSALCINVYHLAASFGQETSFGITGSMTSSLFSSEDGEDEEAGENDAGFSSLPFQSLYEVREALDSEWRFDFDLDQLQRDSISISHARLWLTEIGAVASTEQFTVSMSGVISMPELLGDDFAITVNQLSLGTNGIAVGGVEVQADRQEFSLFGDRVLIGVDQVRPDYNSDSRVFILGIDGSLEVLKKKADFTNLRIGTDGSFGIDNLAIDLLEDDLDIIENHLVLTGLLFNMNGEGQLQFLVDGEVTLPEPFSQTSEFSVSITQTGRRDVEVAMEGLGFSFDEESRAKVHFGDIATLALTGVDLAVDFQNVANTTIYASANLEIHDEDPEPGGQPKLIMFGESGNIRDKYGLRYNYGDGLSFQITSRPTPGSRLFAFSAGFFSVEIETLSMPETGGFAVEIGGKAGITLPGLEGRAEFEGFTIAREGIRDFGRFRGDGGLEAKLMNVVTLSLGNFEYEKFDDPYILSIVDDADDPDPDDPAVIEIEVLEYLLVENAKVTLNGKENGSAGANDAYGGSVERILFYRTVDGMSLQIENAELTVPAASIEVSMTYYSMGSAGRSLSVAGKGQFGFDDTGVEIGVAGKISNINNELSFGLFVKAGVDPGIPVIPALITLKGLGGGFYYNPDETDFNYVRRVAGLTYLTHPEFDANTKFAVFLYAGVGLIGEAQYYIDGDFFMEITNGATSLHVDGALFFQGDKLKTYMYLGVEYGDNPIVQGLCSLAIDYRPALYGGGEIGFFAKPGPGDPPVLWAVYGGSKVNFFVVETTSDFIVCNDGLLANMNIRADYDGSLIKLEGSLDASVWYLNKTSDLGAYGLINAMISVAGASVQGTLLGAFVNSGGERFLYAQGDVNVDVILWEGSASAWASYSRAGWDGGRGSNPEFERMIADSRRQADQLQDAAGQAADDVAAAIKALEDARRTEDLAGEIGSWISGSTDVEVLRTQMNDKISYVLGIENEITGMLRNAINYSVDLRDHTGAISGELINPLTWSAGSVSGQGEDLVVNESPAINVNQMVAQNNETELADYIQNLELQLEYYEEAIAGTMLNLMELERMIEGSGQLSSLLMATAVPLMGTGFTNLVESSFQFTNIHQPGFQGGMDMQSSPGGPSDMYGEPVFSVNSAQPALFQSRYSLHYLSDKYAEAAEAVKEFYSSYMGLVHHLHEYYKTQSNTEFVEAIRLLAETTEQDYNDVFTPLEEMHVAFTGSLEILYTLKAEITATLYGMIEEYIPMRSSVQQSSPVAVITGRDAPATGITAGDGNVARPVRDDKAIEMAALRDEITGMLEPPVITSFVINPADDDEIVFQNRADIFWQAHHPGNIAETSYLIQRRSLGGFVSAGTRGSLKHYTWKPASYMVPVVGDRSGRRLQNSYNIAIRARGSGGNTTIRSASISLRIDENGQSSGGEYITDDVPPPLTPVIELPSYRSVLTTTHETYQPSAGFTPSTGFGPSGSSGSAGINIENIYYTNERSMLNLNISAHDEQTDIQKFEYALGSLQGQTDIVDWREAVGVTSSMGVGGSGVTRSMKTVIRNLNLEHGVRYYLSARVTNSAGKTSSFSMSDPVVYDALPPSAPGFVNILGGVIGTGTIQFGSSSPEPPVYPVVTKIPLFLPGRVNYPSNYAGEASITRSWKSGEDDLSGIQGYEYVLTPVEDAVQAFSLGSVEFTEGLTTTVTGGIVTWTDPLYLHIRSKNNAGSVSEESITYGPFMPPDPSAPTPPVINAMVQSTGVKFYMPLMSGDYESQVAGYQYSMGTSPGATNIRNWSSGLDFDHGWTTTYPQQVSPNPPKVPVFHIPQEHLPPGDNHNIYVNVRAVNGQQKVSPVVSSGPFRWNTIPEEPLVTHDYNIKTGLLNINIENIADEGAPISHVSYRVIDIESGKILQDWTGIEYSGSKLFGQTGSVSTTTHVEGVGKSGLAVDVQTTSTTGASKTTTVQNTTTTGVQSSTFNILGGTGFR